MNGRWKFVAALFVALLVAVACGDDGGGDGDAGGSTANGGAANGPTTTVAPQSGGVLTYAANADVTGFDPAVTTGGGTVNGIHMMAIYDTVMRWNPETQKYENRTADSLINSADFTSWTLKLKAGIKFSDGTDYDADAVKFSMDRHRSGLAGAPPCAQLFACPRASSANTFMLLVKDIQVVDKLTVQFVLTQPWTGFQWALSTETGMIVSPTAMRKCDPTKPAAECAFTTKPVGAGPFILESFVPKEATTLKRNPNYYGGAVYLDGIKIIPSSDNGGQQTYASLKNGTFQGAYLRDATAIAGAKADKFVGVTNPTFGGQAFLLNVGLPVNCSAGKPAPVCTGKPDGPTATTAPTGNPTVRKAIAAALDPKVLDARGNNGNGFPTSEWVTTEFPWYPGPNGVKYDPELAKKLVAQAKTEGWDGKIRLLSNNAPGPSAIGIAAQTMLQVAGMDVTLDDTKDFTTMVSQVVTAKDFDMVQWNVTLPPDDGTVSNLAAFFQSTSTGNKPGYKSPVVDKALAGFLTATTDAEKKALYKSLFDQMTLDVPMIPWAKTEELVAFSPKIHGVVGTGKNMVAFEKASISQ